MDHHHGDVNKTASKVRFAEPGAEPTVDESAPSPPLSDNEEKDKDDKVNMFMLLLRQTLKINAFHLLMKCRVEIFISIFNGVTFYTIINVLTL